ncbi:beta-ketoacyl synthase N-terminal-like domain-containing protein [Streptomyces anulatus]|uniref:beta-ketoacyl synthase N-terminal-like domain-containing protein n=1 Tax=Streptomyces anulatus TaxID=1892 RepID=UPI0036B888E0
MSELAPVVISGVGTALPGVTGTADLVTGPALPAEPVDPAAVLGKRGLKYKDRATQLGLCVAFDGLKDAGLRDDEGPRAEGARIGVVVASNYGNVDTVCRVTTTIANETSRGTSPMDSPNASSNIIASEIAIRYKLGGPNLTVCNGDASGLDALRWAATMLNAGRADQFLVIGVEPDNEMVRKLVGADRIVDGAVAVVLEREETAQERGARIRARIDGFARTGTVEAGVRRLRELGDDAPGGWYLPETAGSSEIPADLLAGVPRHGMPDAWGALSGVLGVLQCAVAAGRFDAGEQSPVYATAGRDGDGIAGAVLCAPRGTR